MANSLATLNGALIARRALETLLEEFPLLSTIAADFSPEAALFNQVIDVKLPSALTAGDYNTTTGYVSQDVTQIDAPVTINKHKHVTYEFNEQERSSTNMNLIERFARNSAQAIGLAMMNDLFALLLAANFTNNTVQLASAFNRTSYVSLSKKLNGRKLPKSGRYSVINSDYYEKLAADTILVSNAGSPSDAVRSGRIGNVHGFSVDEYYQLPANGQALAGFAGVPEGLAIAARVPVMPDSREIAGSVEIVTEPNTGLSMMVRSWYDMRLGKEIRTYTIMYGVAVGNPASIERLTLS